jgi:hypothetical protein
VQAVKITTLNARLPEYLPSVTGIATAMTWCSTRRESAVRARLGQRRRKACSVEPDMLIPADLRKTYDMANLPQADILDDVALGGEGV